MAATHIKLIKVGGTQGVVYCTSPLSAGGGGEEAARIVVFLHRPSRSFLPSFLPFLLSSRHSSPVSSSRYPAAVVAQVASANLALLGINHFLGGGGEKKKREETASSSVVLIVSKLPGIRLVLRGGC